MSENNPESEADESPRSMSRRIVLTGIGAAGLLGTTGLATAESRRAETRKSSRGRRRGDPMNLELKGGRMHLGVDAPSASETATVAARARGLKGGPSRISWSDVEESVEELNEATENGMLEVFEKDDVVHVRPTEKQLSQLRSD